MISRVSYSHGLSFHPNNSRYLFGKKIINKRVEGLEIFNFYLFATEQVTCSVAKMLTTVRILRIPPIHLLELIKSQAAFSYSK